MKVIKVFVILFLILLLIVVTAGVILLLFHGKIYISDLWDTLLKERDYIISLMTMKQ